MDDSIAGFVNSVDISHCKIVNTPNFVFLCGGLTQKDAGPYLSARDYFHRHLKANHPDVAKRVKLAEAINDWFDHDLFSDLLEVEEHLADLSDLIVVFVESAGSIAELGAFASSESLRGKVLALMNSTHRTERTFISDGPVRRIKDVDDRLVMYYEWAPEDLADPSKHDEFDDMSEELAKLLMERERSAVKQPQLGNSHGHIMLLVADLIEMLGITIETEISECLTAWGYDINREKLHKYLFLLEHLLLITKLNKSNQTYYLGRARSVFVAHSFKQGVAVRDRDGIKALLRLALPTRDERRAKIYEKQLAKRPKRGVHV